MNERKQITIPIRGLDVATGDAAVEDGACDRLHNLRYRAGEWHGVCAPVQVTEVTAADERIVCRHAALPDGEYITRQGRFLYHARLNNRAFTHLKELFTCGDTAGEPQIACHGNVLQIGDRELNTVFEKTYLYDPAAAVYALFDMNAVAPPSVTDVALNITTAETAEIAPSLVPGHRSTLIATVKTEKNDCNKVLEREFRYNSYLGGATGIPGTFLFFLGYKMFDGSVVRMSEVQSVRIAGPGMQSFYMRTTYDGDTRIADYYAPVKNVSPVVSFTVDPLVKNSPLFSKVGVYATRNAPPYLWDELDKQWNATPLETLFDNHVVGNGGVAIALYDAGVVANEEAEELPGTPFYEIAELDLEETSVTLTYDAHFKNIETKSVYAANYSNHKLAASGHYYYNNRLHAYGLQFTYAAPAVRFPYAAGGPPHDLGTRVPIPDSRFYIRAVLNAEGRKFTAQAIQSAFKFVQGDGSEYIRLPDFLSYPDARAERIELYLRTPDKWYRLLSVPLKAAYANNIAWARLSVVKLAADGLTQVAQPPLAEARCLIDNKVYVSKADNMFYFDPKHVISLDDETIRCLATGTEQLSEGRFGDYPLHIFTDDGIYVAENGQGEVLYSRVVPLCRDVPKPGAPVAAVRGRLVYLTGAGVTVLEGRRSSCLSRPLHDPRNRFDAYLSGTDTLLYLPVYDELLVYNPSHTFAYVCALESGIWSTRDFSGGKYIAPGLLWMPGGVYSTARTEDAAKPLAAEMRTRPLKLGSFEMKRIDVLSVRLKTGNFTVRIEASHDLQNWESIRVSSSHRLRRTPNSYPYYRVGVGGSAEPCILSVLQIEYRDRFVTRLR